MTLTHDELKKRIDATSYQILCICQWDPENQRKRLEINALISGLIVDLLDGVSPTPEAHR